MGIESYPEWVPHPTVTMTIKTAEVDEEIAPLVAWMNGFREVITLFCCQGEAESPTRDRPVLTNPPHILFLCFEPTVLVHLLGMIEHSGKCQVSLFNGVLRYDFRFTDRATVLRCISRLRHLGEIPPVTPTSTPPATP